MRILAIPKGVPEPDVPPADGTAKVIAAAGRLARAKWFDLLIEAFAEVAAKHPHWNLRIYGDGIDRERLQQLIETRNLSGQVGLMGVRSPIEAEFAKASIMASASDAESFGVTLMEAMRCGVPVVAADCPLAPPRLSTTASTAAWSPWATGSRWPPPCST